MKNTDPISLYAQCSCGHILEFRLHTDEPDLWIENNACSKCGFSPFAPWTEKNSFIVKIVSEKKKE